MSYFISRLVASLQNPIWYVVTVAALIVLVTAVPSLWWLAGAVALSWGIWLIVAFFGDEDAPSYLSGHNQVQLQAYLERTLAYKEKIEGTVQATTNQYNHFHHERLLVQLDACSRAVAELVERLASLQQDDLIGQDMTAVPQAITTLEKRLANETNAVIAVQLEQLLSARRNQWALLQRLQNAIQQTEIQIEHTLSLLGTIYSQLLLGQSTNDMADYGRLAARIDEETRRLSDQLEALREVKGEYWGGKPADYARL